MRFRVLGPLEVSGAPLAGGRQRALLALLLAREGRVLTTTELTTQLWGDEPPRDAVAATHNLISRLRRALDHGELRTHPAGYRLVIDADQVDARRFAALVGQARADGRPPAEAARLLSEALDLWRGAPYDGVDDLPDLRLAAIRLDELRLSARQDRAEAWLRAGDASAALADLELLVREQPLREGPRALYLRALYAAGRHADALADLRSYRTLLAQELGLEPSAALQGLERSILRHDEGLVPPSGGSFARMHVAYLTAPGARRLAVATVGSGFPLVAVPAWVTSLEVIASGRDPRSSLLERLSHLVALTLYDRYGTGLSRGEMTDFGLAATVAELAAVVQSVGRPAGLLAVSQSGPIAATLAARRPDLVSHLVFFGTYADASETFVPEVRDAMVHLVRAHWGIGARAIAELYRPGCSSGFVRHLGRVIRESADSEVAAGYLDAGYNYRCGDLLPSIRAPALVIHYRGDRVIPFRGGRQLAAGLPDAQFVPLDGGYHLPDASDLDGIVAAIAEFLPI
jgi:DNA-binding SARP family transcriptional activator/pimeloyl-ACP methyl ester carboxylesterase